ncbi:unnamed protein product [Mycena citricolor]|uniref:Uncharacterized protein n=1 Tax=Mycena citricolor TaxID=2018698 RepID=A0AAD2HW47_9AGAR|nr:unnamed protein product [Mycena citricolor]
MEASLVKLAEAISRLPDGRLAGARTGPLGQHLWASLDNTGTPRYPEDEEGPYKAFNIGWERAFRIPPGRDCSSLFPLVCQGKYGLILAHNWAKHYASLVQDMDVKMIQLRVDQLLDLISAALKAHISDVSENHNLGHSKDSVLQEDGDATEAELPTGESKKRKKKDSGQETHKVINLDAHEPATASQTTKKQRKKHRTKSPDASNDDTSNETTQAPAKKAPAKKKAAKKKTVVVDSVSASLIIAGGPLMSSKSSSSSEDEDDNSPARTSNKLTWALSQYLTKEAKSVQKGEKRVWKVFCRYCNKYRTTLRTKGVQSFADETLPLSTPSNWISHALECTRHPVNQSFETFQSIARNSGTMPASDVTASDQTNKIMTAFLQRGREQPESQSKAKVTKPGYRERVVVAAVTDDMVYSFTEKPGMQRLLEYILPENIPATISHQTISRDVESLHKALAKKLHLMLQENDSQISIASDIVTTRGMVHSFCGIVVSFIDKDWVRHEYVLDLIPLNGDHSGKTVGRLIYKHLHRAGIVTKMIASAANNASSNGPMNEEVVRRCCKALPDFTMSLETRNFQIGCGGHVTNLVAQKIDSVLGLCVAPEVEDLYDEIRSEPLFYDIEQDPVALEEQRVMEQETMAGVDPDECDSEDEQIELEDESTSELESEEEWEDEENGTIHSAAVYILCSEIRRKKDRRFIRRKVQRKYRHLVFVRSMRVRWNTRLAELRRAYLLRAVFDYFVERMGDGFTGKALAAAQRKIKKWRMDL